MQKVTLVFLGLLALSSAASVFADEDASTLAPSDDSTTLEPTEDVSTASTAEPAEDVSTASTAEPAEDVSTASTAEDASTVTTSAPSTGSTEEPGECVYDSQTWGVPNLGLFKFCLDGKPYETKCNENSYYVRNDQMNGCIPAASMDPNCVNTDVVVGDCTGINLKQPQASQTLTDFYLCTAENAEPVELTCLDNKAFLNQDGYLGCFDWELWRKVRNCQTYSNDAI